MGNFSLEVVPPEEEFQLDVIPPNLPLKLPNQDVLEKQAKKSFSLEVVPVSNKEFVDVTIPQVKEKGRNRFFSKLGNLAESAKGKIETVANFAKKYRSTTLVLSAAFLRFGVSKLFDIDLATTDNIIRSSFALGITAEKVGLPLAEKVSSHFGYDIAQKSVYQKGRNIFRDVVAIAGGWSLESMVDFNFQGIHTVSDTPSGEVKDEKIDLPEVPQQEQQNFNSPNNIKPYQPPPQHREWELPMGRTGPQPDFTAEESYERQTMHAWMDHLEIKPVAQETLPANETETLEVQGMDVLSQSNPSENVQIVHGLPPTKMANGIVIEGSVIDGTLTSNGQKYYLFENGVNNLNLLKQFGGFTEINEQLLKTLQQKGLELCLKEELDPVKYPIESAVFHISNGTQSIFKTVINADTYQLLHTSGVIR